MTSVRYHVFIDGSRDPSPGGKERLAAALGQRYGMSAPVISQRLAQGRFCAWASVDLATARRLGGELETLGATYTVVEEGSEATAAPPPAAARSTLHGLPAPSGPRPDHSSALAAARRDVVSLDLGALGGAGASQDASWQLSRLDGSEEERTSESPTLVAAMSAAERAAAPPRPGRKSSAPPPRFAPAVDPFAPPDAGREAELQLEDKVPIAGTVASAPGATTAPGGHNATGGVRTARPTIGASTLNREPFTVRFRESMATNPRARFVAGVAVAFFVGLVAAQIFAMWRGDDAVDEVVSGLQAEYRRADSPETWETLDTARDDAAALIASRQQRVAVSACLLWLALAAGVSFLWFRVIDWEGAVPRLAPAQESDAAAAARRRATR